MHYKTLPWAVPMRDGRNWLPTEGATTVNVYNRRPLLVLSDPIPELLNATPEQILAERFDYARASLCWGAADYPQMGPLTQAVLRTIKSNCGERMLQSLMILRAMGEAIAPGAFPRQLTLPWHVHEGQTYREGGPTMPSLQRTIIVVSGAPRTVFLNRWHVRMGMGGAGSAELALDRILRRHVKEEDQYRLGAAELSMFGSDAPHSVEPNQGPEVLHRYIFIANVFVQSDELLPLGDA